MKKEIDPKEFKTDVFKNIGSDWFLITAEKDGKTNAMTAGWGGMGFMWGKNVAYIVIRPSRYTKEFVDAAGRFSLCFPSDKYKKQKTYLGTVSGRDENKIQKCGMKMAEADGIPYFEESRYVLFCKTLYAQEMKEDCFRNKELVSQWYPIKDFHTLYVAEVEKILVEE